MNNIANRNIQNFVERTTLRLNELSRDIDLTIDNIRLTEIRRQLDNVDNEISDVFDQYRRRYNFDDNRLVLLRDLFISIVRKINDKIYDLSSRRRENTINQYGLRGGSKKKTTMKKTTKKSTKKIAKKRTSKKTVKRVHKKSTVKKH
jgi:hypothetical protein